MSDERMTWEQKFAAIKAIDHRAHLMMRELGDWYVSARGDLRSNGMLRGAFGNGTTPQEAVEDHWRQWTEGQPTIVVDAFGPDRRVVRWNGFMWEPDPR